MQRTYLLTSDIYDAAIGCLQLRSITSDLRLKSAYYSIECQNTHMYDSADDANGPPHGLSH